MINDSKELYNLIYYALDSTLKKKKEKQTNNITKLLYPGEVLPGSLVFLWLLMLVLDLELNLFRLHQSLH